MTKRLLFNVFFLLAGILATAQTSTLSVEKIMQDPKWMGTFPTDIKWDDQSAFIYFNYNLDNDPDDSLYRVAISNPSKIEKVNWKDKNKLVPFGGSYNSNKSQKVYSKDNTLKLYSISTQKITDLIQLPGNISNAVFLQNDKIIAFQYENNAFTYNLENGTVKKLTNIKSGEAPKEQNKEFSDKNKWLKDDNLSLLEVINQREEKKENSENYRNMTSEKSSFEFFLDKKRLINMVVSPNQKYITFNLYVSNNSDPTIVPDFIDASGYTKDLNTRSKVGDNNAQIELAIYSVEKDTVYFVSQDDLPGIKDLPDYVKDYPEKEWEEKIREVNFSRAYFSDNGSHAIVNVRSKDNKDRWITKLDLESGYLETLDRQRDEAWIAGPGIGWSMGGGTLGWLPDNKHIYYQSEATGYSHLYIQDVTNGRKKALTSGKFEVFDPFISNDKKHWYLTTSEVHPGERHFYKMPLMGGKMEKLTTLIGNNEVSLSPDEKFLAIRHSYSNRPWELYYKPNIANVKETPITSGQSDEFKEYNWRKPKLINFSASDDVQVPARLYTPAPEVKNGAAVIFVHGAGYLQNVHKWWSSYFREYMFHNLLTDLGYTVLDIDYRGSAGYGRDWRTAIYRHMGGKDLSDQVDGAGYLVEEFNIDPDRIGIYGGSYGGFITLMGLFNESETFKSGAALRSVTDWAHYNHGYTSNILNEPYNDPIAYRRSSPIYFIEGLKGHLLIAHGMVDVNVHFQDVVRLVQRLIELEKDNWEMAVYPAEDHGFVEPSSWTDEYKRILKLFNNTLIKK
ncbi:S9 family peptidase [Planktosalinus lacus]|uniref:Peptidase S9 n=1 Tax=Planktosalinus lacus TaxID=1526573 RepID=A0A8J2VBA4_9FLAO|nr:prolyl oligopeptidase family serine peptidase [Planktosalinus lacus]GGD98017.1 peptidase S9 [Planktosalinus lacus]